MGTEVKIGMAIGLALLVLIIVYVSVVGDNPQPASDTPHWMEGESQSQVSRVEVADEQIEQLAVAEPPAVVLAAEPIAPAESETGVSENTPTAREAELIVSPVESQNKPTEAQSAKTRTYIVSEGDMGFWDIALKEYGDAKFQDLIAAANPKADPTKLRPGQKLILPPAATQVPAVTRKGGDVYVVQEGDAGFWGIAQKKYGHGKYWTRIQRANPGVDAYNLRAGQQLIIPPLSQSSAAAPAPTVSATTPPGARKVYTVQAGDAGFWGVAKKVYGDGKYHEVIASANPDADSAKLKPGQKLIIPPLTLLDRRQSQRASSGSGGVSDKPTFE